MVDVAPDTGERVGVVEGDEPIDAAEDTTRKEKDQRSLTQRMAAIRKAASGVGKDEITMGSYKIKAHTIEGVLHGMRSLLDANGIWMEMHLVERSYSGNRCDALFEFRFENMDDATDARAIRYAGAGTDNSDKAFAKAGTNALKEMLKKTFLITDREDAKEEEDRVEHESEGATRAKLNEAQEQARSALEKWAVSFKAAVASASSVDDLKRLQRENKDQLSSENLPAVTRSFFVDLIERRKKELGE